MNRIQKISIVLVALVFTLDMLIPLGIAIGALYMFCILLVNKSDNRFIIYLTSVICTLILFKLLIYMNEDTHWMSYLNRFTSVSIIIGSAFFVSKFNNDIDKGNESLNQHVEKLKSLDNIIENLIEGAQVIGYDWKYLYANNSLCKQVNLSKNDLIGKTMMEMYPGIENSNLFNELKASMEDRKPKILLN